MNGIYWNMHATSMEYVCGIYGMCMESVWNMYGICMEYVWNNMEHKSSMYDYGRTHTLREYIYIYRKRKRERERERERE
jgi:hypothetical protein